MPRRENKVEKEICAHYICTQCICILESVGDSSTKYPQDWHFALLNTLTQVCVHIALIFDVLATHVAHEIVDSLRNRTAKSTARHQFYVSRAAIRGSSSIIYRERIPRLASEKPACCVRISRARAFSRRIVRASRSREISSTCVGSFKFDPCVHLGARSTARGFISEMKSATKSAMKSAVPFAS